MNILTEEECRDFLAHPAINHNQMARWFYEGVERKPVSPDNAFRRVLSVSPLTERTRMRLSGAVLRHFHEIAEAYNKVSSDADEQII